MLSSGVNDTFIPFFATFMDFVFPLPPTVNPLGGGKNDA